jgi:exodeoxyribonuclease VII large subunit
MNVPEAADTFSVSQLGRRIADAVAAGLPHHIWVTGHVADKRESAARNGIVRFSLIEQHATGTMIAKIPVYVPGSAVATIRAACREAGIVVRDGVPVKLRGNITYAPRWGTVSFEATGIDTSYTLGQLAVDREQLIAELERRGLFAAQRKKQLTHVPLRLACVTSAGAAAFADIRARLDQSGYGFELVCFDTPVQGDGAATSVARAIDAATTRFTKWVPDVIIVARGGGARGDLAVFDDPRIAEAIARCPTPVLTGIGHEIDTHIADLAAWRRCSTPTDAARYIVETVDKAVNATSTSATRAKIAVSAALDRADDRCDTVTQRLTRACLAACEQADANLDREQTAIATRARRILADADTALSNTQALINAHNPTAMFERGWTITRGPDGRPIRDTNLTAGTPIETFYAGGVLRSTVTDHTSYHQPATGPHLPQTNIEETDHHEH